MINNLKDLKIGDTGNDVRILQQKLKILNIYPASITGSFDETTKNSVEIFQEENNLDVTGIVGFNTWSALFNETSNNNIETFDLSSDELNNTTNEIEDIQEKLKTLLYYDGFINGEYDIKTEEAIQTYQLNNMITATGIINNETLNSINDNYKTLTNCNISLPTTTDKYTIKKGDTLYSIAKNFNTTVDNLKKINNLTNDILTIGQIINVPTTNEDKDNLYTVKKGDTLYSIAKAFNISVDDLKKANNLTSNTLSINQILTIPTETNNYINYTVKKGDTLYSIARNYNVSVNELLDLNNLSSSVLAIGQTLVIPITEDDNYITYYVKKGDTLYNLANSYNTTVDQIKSINNLITNTLSIGQKLLLPTT